MYLSSFALTEPDDIFYFYTPSWLNAWESHLYYRALASTQARGWGFKRFGTTREVYFREMIRKPQYEPYLQAFDDVCDSALSALTTRQRMQLMKSRTAFIYVDAWGESGAFENIASALHIAAIDTLPKNLLKKFSVKDLTCKVRGERQSFMQAMRMAEDYLNWNVFDFVVICAAYRAVPVLVFSEVDTTFSAKKPQAAKRTDTHLSVERVGCFIFSQQPGPLKVTCGHYVSPQEVKGIADRDMVLHAGVQRHSLPQAMPATAKVHHLTDIYGDSGCLTPALSWIYAQQHPLSSANIRTTLSDNHGGYSYFDTEYSQG